MNAPFWPSVDRDTQLPRLWLGWLVRLRWVAIGAQLLTLSFALHLLAYGWVLVPLLAVGLVLVAANVRAIRRLGRDEPLDETTLVTQLVLDVVALTAIFVCAGGTNNPFVALYLIHVAMAAVMLPIRHAAAVTALAILGFVFVGQVHVPLVWTAHTLPAVVLRPLGEILAFSITGISVLVFVTGLSATLRRREHQLLAARDRTARTDRLRTVGTMAAGAAHELNTPLATLGLRLGRVGRRHVDADTQRDVEVAREQVERCTHIVQQLLFGAGDPSGSELVRLPIRAFVDQTLTLWSKGARIPVRVDDTSAGALVSLPRIAFTQAFVNLLENAREAQEGSGPPIEVTLEGLPGRVAVVIRDHGCGLPAEPDRVGDPFYTTKTNGTGLGVFVARSVAEGAGGSLSYRRLPDGTEARWVFPTA